MARHRVRRRSNSPTSAKVPATAARPCLLESEAVAYASATVELTQVLATVDPMRPAQVLNRTLRGEVANIDFVDLVNLVLALGFVEVGGRGSHRVFARVGVKELINLQAERGQAKPYQVRQIATVVRRYDLTLEDER